MPEKLTYQAVIDRFNNEGCTLLSTNYISISDPLEYICRCGNTESISLKIFGKRPGYKCSKCPEKKEFPKALSIISVIDIFKAHNCTLISKRYYSNKKPLEYLCSCGNKNVCSITLSTFQLYGTNCQACRADRTSVTMKERYGVDFNIQRDGYKDKMLSGIMQYIADKKHTYEFVKLKFAEKNLDLLDVEYINGVSKLQYKCRVCLHESAITFLQLYNNNEGCGSISCVSAKRMLTSQARFGTDYPSQSIEISKKLQKQAYNRKKYTMPSGLQISIQGFEHFALDLLIQKFLENEIMANRADVPEIWYTNGDGKYRRYFCDFYIAKHNLIIEVKSTYTYLLDFKKNDYKRKACEYAGYNFKLMLFDDRKKLISNQSFLHDIE